MKTTNRRNNISCYVARDDVHSKLMNLDRKRKLIALVIWWCEGTKIRKDKRWKNSYVKVVEVTNTNPSLIKLFVDFLRSNLKVRLDKMKGQIQIHEGDDLVQAEDFWENAVGIPKMQFNKTIIRKAGNKPGKTRGTFKVRVYGREIFDRLNDLLNEELGDIITESSADGSAHRLGR